MILDTPLDFPAWSESQAPDLVIDRHLNMMHTPSKRKSRSERLIAPR